MDVGEAAIDAVAADGQLGVIKTQKMQEGGVNVVHLGWV